MAPVHADEVDSAIVGDTGCSCQGRLEEINKILAGEFAGCHRKLIVLDVAATDDVPNSDVVWRVEETHCSRAPAHEAGKSVGLASIPTENAVAAKLPKIARLARGSGNEPLRIDAVAGV